MGNADSRIMEGENKEKTVDFFISESEEGFIVDIFDKAIKDNDEAHLESFDCDTYEEALETGLDYIKD